MSRLLAVLTFGLTVMMPACAEEPDQFINMNSYTECVEAARNLYEKNISAGESQAVAYDRYAFQVDVMCAGLP